MFLCDDCHDDRCAMTEIEDLMRSGGRCEGCYKGAACRDCHGYRNLPPRIVITEQEEP